MSIWYYYNENGEKIQVTGGQLKGLAKTGMITPETIVETEEGKKARAGKVKGLTFVDVAPPETAPSPHPQPAPSAVNVDAFNDALNAAKNNPSPSIAPAMPTAPTLHAAVALGKIEDVKSHIAKGADVNAKNKDGLTPLHQAAFGKRVEIVQLLVSAGADVNAKDKNDTVLLAHMVTIGQIEIVKILVSAGAHVNVKNKDGNSPLHHAVFAGSIELVKLLVSNGANVIDAKDKHGRTALDYATTMNKVEMVQYFSSLPEVANQPIEQPETFMGSVFGQCPFCKKWWARKLIEKTFHKSRKGSYTTHETVNETRNRSGEIIATTTRPVRQSYTVKTYRYDYQCKKCGHVWYEIS